ncbi:MAG: GNAT family N-acetyltransferase [Candidatus Nanopelagicales bacterium]
MPRSAITVTRVCHESMDSLAPLWEDLRATVDSGVVPGGGAGLDRARARWLSAAEEPGRVVLVAWDGTDPVGVAALSVQEIGPWSAPTVVVGLLHVHSGARHRGVGRALLVEALAHADRIGTDQIAVDVPPHLRDAQRFYARLGFAPVVTRRVTGTAGLRRRLLGDQQHSKLAGLRARATRRRRQAAGVPAPAVAPEAVADIALAPAKVTAPAAKA